MLKSLVPILEIQEFDMQMIQLMRLKKERLQELQSIQSVKKELQDKEHQKQEEIKEIKKDKLLMEGDVEEVCSKIKRLEQQQSQIKKVEEFNALSHEMSQAERERTAKEQRLSDLLDKLTAEEDILEGIQEGLKSTVESSQVLENEIRESIQKINEEGQILKAKRDKLAESTDPEVFRIYERLLKNKKDRVVVPIENRCCSGCHITLTAQDENMVRKGERIMFCEHCSRIHFWPESEAVEGTQVAPKTRRRRRAVKT